MLLISHLDQAELGAGRRSLPGFVGTVHLSEIEDHQTGERETTRQIFEDAEFTFLMLYSHLLAMY